MVIATAYSTNLQYHFYFLFAVHMLMKSTVLQKNPAIRQLMLVTGLASFRWSNQLKHQKTHHTLPYLASPAKYGHPNLSISLSNWPFILQLKLEVAGICPEKTDSYGYHKLVKPSTASPITGPLEQQHIIKWQFGVAQVANTQLMLTEWQPKTPLYFRLLGYHSASVCCRFTMSYLVYDVPKSFIVLPPSCWQHSSGLFNKAMGLELLQTIALR